ncbi:MAG: DUF2442 domain-containing protein [Bacteroidota bacterium]|nr:DUF2442 domain-containing protein [Bacteroidota bacterium]
MHNFYKIISFSIEAPYTLRILFDDNTQQTINFLPVLYGEVFRPLREISLFNQAYIDKEVHTIVWPNGADFDPSVLHDWEKNENELVERAKKWDVVETH